jgi:parallel beta-helix repeat protein
LYVTWDNKILGNDIRDNDHGVWVDDSYNNTIVRNMIVNNTRGAWDTGVHLTDNTQDNEIHENCFYDNEPHAVDDGTNNDWTGNY